MRFVGLVGGELVAGFLQFEADFHMGDGIGRHHNFIAIQSGKQMVWHIRLPIVYLLFFGFSFGSPFLGEMMVNPVNDGDEEGGGAGCGVEDLDEMLVWFGG